MWTGSSAACCSVYQLAQLEASTAKGALEKKHKFCSPRSWERVGPVPAQVTFPLYINDGRTANTIILSGLLAINLPFCLVSFLSIQHLNLCGDSTVILVEVRCVFSASCQPNLLKGYVLCGVLGRLLRVSELRESW